MTDSAQKSSERVELSDGLKGLLDENDHGVIATVAKDGTARQSVVYFTFRDGMILVSTLTDRAKSRDVRRTGWASISVAGEERPHPSATFSGTAEIRTTDIGPDTARVMERIAGKGNAPELTDEQLAEAGRVILAIQIEKVSAVSYVD